ncbi:MAG: hypothetical protein QM311_03400, partial [Acidobacteriota bacterium]|nr:hypothetical protein [Acidobacteriota bacterium]
MKTRLVLLFALVMTCLPAARLHGEAPPVVELSEPAIDQALAAVYPALVNLSGVRVRFVEGRAVRGVGAGSGVCLCRGGRVVAGGGGGGGGGGVRGARWSGGRVG